MLNSYICLALEKALEILLSYGEKKVQEEGLEALNTTFLDVLADMLKEIKCKMVKYAQPIMMLAKNILALKVRTKLLCINAIYLVFTIYIFNLFFQIGDGNNPGELDELDSENNEFPIEYAGNVISNISYVVPPQVFTEYFISLMPLIKKLLVNII